VIRAAKESLNGIDPVDVKRSYRYEQGFTFELNLSGVSDEARAAFVDKRPARFENELADRVVVVTAEPKAWAWHRAELSAGRSARAGVCAKPPAHPSRLVKTALYTKP